MEINLTSAYAYAFLLAAVPALINVCLASYIFIRLRHRFITDVLGLLLLSAAGWQVSAALMHLSADVKTALLFDNIVSPIGFFATPLILHLALFIRNPHKTFSTRRPILVFTYMLTFAFAMIYPAVNNDSGYLYSEFWGWINSRQSSIFHAVFGVFTQVIFMISAGIFGSELLKSKRGSNRNKQLKLILFSLLAIISQALITEALFPQVFNLPPVPITSLTIAFFSVAAFIALNKYKLFQGLNDLRKDDLLSKVSDFILILDEQLRIAYINNPGLEKLGYSAKELMGRHISTYLTYGENDLQGFLNDTPAQVTNLRCLLKIKNGADIPMLVNMDSLEQYGSSLGYILSCRNISELETAQEQLKKNEQRFKKMIERSKDAVAIIDGKGDITYLTEAVKDIVGYTPAELIGTPFLNLIHPDSVQAALDAFQFNVAYPGEEKTESIYKVIHKAGHDIFIEAIGINQLADTDINGIVSVFRDVTERYKIRQEREQSLALLSSLVQNVNVGILVEDLTGKIFLANNRFCQFFSIPDPNSILGSNYNSLTEKVKSLLVNPEPFSQRLSELRGTKQTVTNDEVAFINGRICERDYFPIRTEKGEVIGHVWRYVDVTSRRHMQSDLIEKNYLLELFQDIGEMGSWISDLREDGDAVWSVKALEICGLTQEEFDGKTSSFFSFIHPDDVNKVRNKSVSAMAKRKPFSLEHRIINKDGVVKWVYTRAFTHYENNRPVRLLGIVQDITRRKEIEHELIKQNKELTKINAELDKFVYSTSHDIRSPLMSILGLINIASGETTDGVLKDYFDKIRNRIQKLDEFTLEIIHYSKNTRTAVQREEIKLRALIEEIIEGMKYQEAARRIKFILDVDADTNIISDQFRLTILLSNLISNAIKYRRDIEDSFVKISIIEKEGFVEISIEDNGEGISGEKLKNIFEMFTRLSARSTGSGLGLYIAKEIANKLLGSIEVESVKGKGTIFKVVLPSLETKTLLQSKELAPGQGLN